MAGHSKWANIKFRKSSQDAKRGKIFTKLIREITIAAKSGADELTNARLRDAITKALKANMKRDTIDNAIKRGSKENEQINLIEMRYEGYGPYGVAFLVDCLSDNKNRTVSEVRHAFTKCGGNLGADGSVAYLFKKQGEIIITHKEHEESIIELAIENGATDIVNNEEQIIIITEASNYYSILETLKQEGHEIEQSEMTMHPNSSIMLDIEAAKEVMKLIDMLEDIDDVQAVYTNANFPENLME